MVITLSYRHFEKVIFEQAYMEVSGILYIRYSIYDLYAGNVHIKFDHTILLIE